MSDTHRCISCGIELDGEEVFSYFCDECSANQGFFDDIAGEDK